ncbi:MAG: hypothetical protein IPP94_06130 [Ignavibacteria bacterium]|nr:hypothetical protein [Ignavibacteria bacterium]
MPASSKRGYMPESAPAMTPVANTPATAMTPLSGRISESNPRNAAARVRDSAGRCCAGIRTR